MMTVVIVLPVPHLYLTFDCNATESWVQLEFLLQSHRKTRRYNPIGTPSAVTKTSCFSVSLQIWSSSAEIWYWSSPADIWSAMEVMGKIESSSSTPQLEESITGASTRQLEEIGAWTPQLEESITGASTRQLEEIGAWTPQLEEIITEDGIFSLILSFLTLREAVRTSVLSSRWRHIWTRLSKFKFEALNMFDTLDAQPLQGKPLNTKEAYSVMKGKTDMFIGSVDSMLRQLHGARLNEFEIRYFLDKSHSHHLDAWVRIAVASQTKSLLLHLYKSYGDSLIERYDFPCHLLRSSRSIETFSLMFCSLKLPTEFDVFGHLKLKRLILINLDVSQEDFDRILPNSYSTLVRLCVCSAPQLVSISIPHPLNQLQSLRIRNCHHLRKIDITAVNLRKLIYKGYLVDFKFQQSSKLTDAHICFKPGGTLHNLELYLSKLSSNLLYLKKLTLQIGAISQMADLPKQIHRFMHLRYLDWEWDDRTKMGLLDLATLLVAAPFLAELKLRFSQRVFDIHPLQTPWKFRETKRAYTPLRKIQISGFYFEMWQIEIAAYLLYDTTRLELMTIKKVTPPKESYERGTEILAREVPEEVKLVII